MLWLVKETATDLWVAFDGPDEDDLDMNQLRSSAIFSSKDNILAEGIHVWTIHMSKGENQEAKFETTVLSASSDLLAARSRSRSPVLSASSDLLAARSRSRSPRGNGS